MPYVTLLPLAASRAPGSHDEDAVVSRRYREEKAAAAAGNKGAVQVQRVWALHRNLTLLPFQTTENEELARACEQLRLAAGAYSPMTLSPRDIPP
jgi:hypothetical protein